MKIYSVFDPEFKPYGQVVDGMEETVQEILDVLKDAPQGAGVDYVPEYEPLQELPAMVEISEHCYGGMPVQLGWCNGHNTRLNCLEYHRDSEFNLGTENFILLLAKQDEIVDGVLDTARVKAFKAPAGVLVALPMGTNTDKPVMTNQTSEDRLLWARNKWLLAHPDSGEAKQGAHIGLAGENIDIANLI